MSKDDSNDIDFTKVFPDSKIKAILMEEESLGRLPAKAITTLNVASALFLNDFVQEASRKDGKELSVDDIKKAIQEKERFHFLQGVLDNVKLPKDSSSSSSSSSLHQRKRKACVQKKAAPIKKTKGDPLSQDPMAQALEVAQVESKARKKEIEVDEEDYD